MKRRVLVVDDEERVTRVLEAILREEFDVTACNDPLQALERIRSKFFHVIVSDQRMPQMEGVELLRRSREVSEASVRILLTGYSEIGAILDSVNEGEIFRFMSKPWQTSEIRNTVREAADISVLTEGAIRSAAPTNVNGSARVAPLRTLGDVLVLDNDEEMFGLIKSQAAGEFAVHHAANIERALGILATSRIAIIVSDMLVAGEDTVRLLRLLKVEYPHILVILASSALDSDAAISLINHIQVFRFVPKPVRSGLLKQNIQSAYMRYRAFSVAPELTKRHIVAAMPEAVPTSEHRRLWDRVRLFVGKLNLVRDRLTGSENP